jgi:hypothetical protein
MADRKYKLIGKLLDDAELQQFPEEAKFSSERTREWKATAITDLVKDETLHHLDRLSLLMVNSITLQCPIGPHDDPGLEVAVVRACNISKTGSVAVECSKGHWAEYPCG